jgi:hypothetical protein
MALKVLQSLKLNKQNEEEKVFEKGTASCENTSDNRRDLCEKVEGSNEKMR